MMATRGASLPNGADWSYEVKWDGYRAEAIKNGAAVSLASRNLKNITRQFPGIVHAVSRLQAKAAVLDGEIVALDAEGRPSFQALHLWSLKGLSLVYFAFDLLHLDGRDLTRLPLDERRAALRDVVGGSAVLLSEPLPGSPGDIAATVRGMGLEGVIAKRRRSLYTPGRRSDSWIKVRFATRQEFVIGGYKPNATMCDSVLVGYYDGAKLMCAGKVRNGLTPALRAGLFDQMRRLQTPRCPFANLPTSRSTHWGEGITEQEMMTLRWVKPKLVVEVSFAEWTRDGSLRHAAFIARRDDKPASHVVRES
jgi:bifunctional non-homologous end joining protein LigD